MKKSLTSKNLAALVLGAIISAPALAADQKVLDEGKNIAFDRSKGNCLACHMIQGGEIPGNIGPPLIAMQARYPDKQALRDYIWDPSQKNPNTLMPPFGMNQVLSEEELDKLVEFIHSL